MLNKKSQLLATLITITLISSAHAAPSSQPTQRLNSHYNGSNYEEKVDLIKRDQIDNTDTLAIPFDDSEIEDEEEINHLEQKKVFDLPTPTKQVK